jgi:methyl-accepting chemotaxis protein
MITSRNQRKWRNILVNPSFQLRLALIHIAFVVLVIAVIFAVFATILYYDLRGSGDLWAQYATARLMLLLLERIVVIVLLIVVASVVYHIVFSHRLCGPLVNMGNTFDSISKGDLTRSVFLRRKDFLKEEAFRVNAMMAGLNDKIGLLKANQTDLSLLAAKLPQGPVEDGIKNAVGRNQALLDGWRLN